MKQRHKFLLAVFGLLESDGKILLMRRYQTGYEDGNYSLPSGHVDGQETITQAMQRELQEELNIKVAAADLEFALLLHRLADDGERVDVFFRVKQWKGSPINNEPDKCDDLLWTDPKGLPTNTIDFIKQVLDQWSDQRYVEFGW